MTSKSPMALLNIAYFIFTCLLGWIVTQNAPQIAVTVLNGSPQLSMGEFMHAAGTAAAGAYMAKKAAGTAAEVAHAGHKILQGGVNTVGGNIAAWRGISQGVDNATENMNMSPGKKLAMKASAFANLAAHNFKSSAVQFMTGVGSDYNTDRNESRMGKGHAGSHNTKDGQQDYKSAKEGAEGYGKEYINRTMDKNRASVRLNPPNDPNNPPRDNRPTYEGNRDTNSKNTQENNSKEK